jgi:hypothetical protein
LDMTGRSRKLTRFVRMCFANIIGNLVQSKLRPSTPPASAAGARRQIISNCGRAPKFEACPFALPGAPQESQGPRRILLVCGGFLEPSILEDSFLGALLEPFPISGWRTNRRAYARAWRVLTTVLTALEQSPCWPGDSSEP